MSFTRWFVYASFTGSMIALSFQPSGVANATPSTLVVDDQSYGSSQDAQRDSRSGKKKGTSDAESSGKMQSDKDSMPGGAPIGKNSKIIDQAREQGADSNPGGNSGSSTSSGSSKSSGSSNMSGSSGTSESGTGGASR